MGIHNLNIDDKVWNEFKEQTNNMSKTVENFMREEIGEEKIKEKLDIIKKSGLTKKQQQLAKLILKRREKKTSIQKLNQLARGKGIYERSDHIKRALKNISISESVPLKREDQTIRPQMIKCKCGSENSAIIISKKEGYCPSCEARLINFQESEVEVK